MSNAQGQDEFALPEATQAALRNIGQFPSRCNVLTAACQAAEAQCRPLQESEWPFFREVTNSTNIPFPLQEVSRPWHKIFLLVQADLLAGGWPKDKLSAAARKGLLAERRWIRRVVIEALRFLAVVLGSRNDGRGLINALDVLRSIEAGVWEGSGHELLQIKGIGPAVASHLKESAGINTIKQLAALEFYELERLMSRNPPFGMTLKRQLDRFPVLDVGMRIHACLGAGADANVCPVWQMWVDLKYENAEVPSWNNEVPTITLLVVGSNGRLFCSWTGTADSLQGGKAYKCSVQARKGEVLKLYIACEGIVGTLVEKKFQI